MGNRVYWQTHLKVVSMLPHVDAEDGDLASHNRVLVLGGDDAQAGLSLLHEPTPAAALDAEEGGGEGRLELVVAAPRLVDIRHQSRGGVWLRICAG